MSSVRHVKQSVMSWQCSNMSFSLIIIIILKFVIQFISSDAVNLK